MIKILVNASKGGVGKTTVAANIALFLAERGYRVWAMDFAQGRQLTSTLMGRECFSDVQRENKIETKELQTMPKKFPGASKFDFLVVDTDDYYEILVEMANESIVKGWNVIIPIMDEYYGLERISSEIKVVITSYILTGEIKFKLNIVPNKIDNPDSTTNIFNALEKNGIERFMTNNYLSKCNSTPPYYIDDVVFHHEIELLLNEMGVL